MRSLHKCLVAIISIIYLSFMILGGQACKTGLDQEHQSHDSHQEHDHGEHDEHEGCEHDEHDHGSSDSNSIRLTDQQMKDMDIELSDVSHGTISRYHTLRGEIVIDPDRLAHVGPRAPGVVVEAKINIGDEVLKGQALAVLESRELADAVASYLAASKLTSLEWINYSREKQLWDKKITSELEYLQAKNEYAKAKIERDTAFQKLLAIGLSEEEIKAISSRPKDGYRKYDITSPFAGTVIERHASLGELLSEGAVAFVIADMSTVWVNLSVYQKDLSLVRKGQAVRIEPGNGFAPVESTIDYVAPHFRDETRTATARVILPNPEGLLYPGMFVKAEVSLEDVNAPLIIPRDAVQTIDNETVVFVFRDGGFVSVPVITASRDKDNIQVTSGLTGREKIVTKGAFDLKAKLVIGSLDPHAGHGH